jgi:hypothetical protein
VCVALKVAFHDLGPHGLDLKVALPFLVRAVFHGGSLELSALLDAMLTDAAGRIPSIELVEGPPDRGATVAFSGLNNAAAIEALQRA